MSGTTTTSHTVVIGAGPSGSPPRPAGRRRMPYRPRGRPPRGASMRQWGHVRLFSPWSLDIDPDAAALLRDRDWAQPNLIDHPTGAELVERYLDPLAAHPSIDPHLRLGATVTAITRRGRSRLDNDRSDSPFIVRYVQGGTEHELTATAVIDASGTWTSPNPLGAAGVPALGEAAVADHITSGIPDVAGADRQRFAGKRVAVTGSGTPPPTSCSTSPGSPPPNPRPPSPGCCAGPTPPASWAAAPRMSCPSAVASGRPSITSWPKVSSGSSATSGRTASTRTDDGVTVADADREVGPFDEIIVATGLRPDLGPLRELRFDLDEIVEAPRALAPLIDPNVHSCGSVPPHGYAELSHPEPGFFIVGMKSYGRAPTFLLRTGYEQVRSVVAALAGDLEAASTCVELTLPETDTC